MPSNHRFRTADKTSPAAQTRAKQYASRQHRELRKHYQTLIDVGQGQCAETVCLHPTRHIPPGAPWHLAHTPDRTSYLGPAHPRCNLHAAAKAGNAKQRRGHPTFRQSRRWL